jgi:anti-sigma-K factor RskA
VASGIHELAAGYALDALDADEREAFEDHLVDCARCRDEVASFQDVGAALALATAGPEPRGDLRARILAAAHAEPVNVVPLALRRRRLVPALAVAAAAAAVAAIALGAWAASLSGRLDDTRAALDAEQRATAVLTHPSARTVELAAGDGRLVVDDRGRAVLVVNELGPAGGGRTYEAWVIRDGAAARAGLFQAGTGTTVVPIDGTVGEGAVVAVTVEKAGGVDAPTSDPIVASRAV